MATNKKRYRHSAHSTRKHKPTSQEKLRAYLDFLTAMPRKQKIAYLSGALASVALIALVIFLLLPRPRTLTMNEQGDYVDKRAGVTYTLAPMQYEPEAWKTTAYAKCEDMLFYPVSGLEPTRYLCSVEAGVAILWCAEDITLPTIEGFAPDQILVCTDTETVMALKTVEKQSHAQAVADAFVEGEGVEIVPDANRTLTLKFTSGGYPGLFYNLSYLECSEGNFLYDRESRKCVDIGTLLVWYINRGDMEADENTLIGGEETDKKKENADLTAAGTADPAGTGA